MTDTVTINGRPIGSAYPPYVIAELSANHNGSLTRALQIIDEAKRCGADAVKLQTYRADTLTIDHEGPGFVLEGGLWKGSKLYDLYEKAHMPWDWHAPLFAHARDVGITIFSSPFDPTAVDLLRDLNAPAYKIASFEIVDIPLIEKAASAGKPLIISTGMASDEEIAEAAAAARRTGSGEVILLYCVSGYPTPAGEANLRTIPAMAARYGVPVGLSDHTLGTAVAIGAVALGAVAIEKHFTISRADGGPDSEFSLEPDELEVLTKGARTTWESLGTAINRRKASEKSSVDIRRSLYAVADIAAHERLTGDNVRSIRPAFGLPPKYLPEVLNRRAKVAIKRGTPLSWDIIE